MKWFTQLGGIHERFVCEDGNIINGAGHYCVGAPQQHNPIMCIGPVCSLSPRITLKKDVDILLRWNHL